ncbi:MAG TPA: glycosyltransferase family 39 protein [Ktedonobacterales bacterium]|nr:glycosyltransferase family 39 protein [Ktedonobacterales bacterium]
MASGTARTRRRSSRRAGQGSHSSSLAAQIRRISPAGWVALGAGVIALALALQTLQGPSTDYDEGVYWQSLRAMADGHPLFSSVFSSQPPLFLLSVYPFYIVFGQSLGAARIALIVFSLAGIAGTYVAGRALGHPAIGAVACLLLALDPLYEHGAHTLQAELPSVALQIWAVTCAILAMRASGRRRTWLVVGSGVLLGCALLTKLFAIVALVPIALYLSVPLAQRWLDKGGHLRWPARSELKDGLRQISPAFGWMAAGLFGAIAVVLLPYIGQLGAAYDQVVRFHLAAAQTDSHTLRDNLNLIVTALRDARLIFLAVPAIVVVVWRRMWVSAPLILWALADFITLVRQQPLLDHHIVLLSPAMALITGCGVYAVWRAFAEPSRERLAQTFTLVALVVMCIAGLTLNWNQNLAANAPLPTRTLSMALALQSVSAPNEIVLSDDQYVAALANRDVPPQLVDTSAVRITSGYLTASQLEDFITRNRVHVILFASGRFDLLPGFRDWVASRYTQVTTFDQNGALFLLEPINNPPV